MTDSKHGRWWVHEDIARQRELSDSAFRESYKSGRRPHEPHMQPKYDAIAKRPVRCKRARKKTRGVRVIVERNPETMSTDEIRDEIKDIMRQVYEGKVRRKYKTSRLRLLQIELEIRDRREARNRGDGQ